MDLPHIFQLAVNGLLSLWVMGITSNGLVPAPPNFSSGNCTNCGILDEELLKMKTVARIKVKILNELGLSQRPSVPPPKQVPGIYDKATELADTEDNSVAEIAEIFSFSEAPENFTDSRIIQFTMAEYNQKRRMEVKSANLLVRIKCPRRKRRKGTKGKMIFLEISSVETDGKVGEVVATLRSEIKKTTWLKLTLPRTLLQNFVESGQQTFCFHVKCQGCRKGTKVVLVHGHKKRKRPGSLRSLPRRNKPRLNKRRPFLILHTRVETIIRNKRSVNECPASGIVSRCCKSSITVNFKDIGWGDWIMSPRQFTTGECYGRCRSVTYNDTVTEQRECKPSRRKSLRLAYLNDNGYLIYTVLPKMVVAHCGCR